MYCTVRRPISAFVDWGAVIVFWSELALECVGLKMEDKNKKELPMEERTLEENHAGENDDVPMSAAMRVLQAKGENLQNEHESQYIGKKVTWLENFWYQHKWHAGLIVFALVIAVVLVWQILTYVRPDVHIMYTGPVAFIGSRYTELEEALIQVMDDYNGDGEKAISFTDNTYLTEEQIEKKQEEAKAQNEDYYPDYSGLRASYGRFQTEMTAAKHMLCMLDPSLYEQIRDMDGFMPLSDIFGETLPDCAADAYGIRLGDTAFYAYYSGVRFIPADTILAVRSKEASGIAGNEKKLEQLKYHAELLRAIASFAPDNAE